jgi:dGTPase
MSKLPLYTEKDTERRSPIANSEDPSRSPFRRDYARLLHSPAFRRLQGKTQLYPGHESDFFRNRLTHSLEVAQIAKGIAQKINFEVDYFKENPIDTDLVEFAALAHDLGHPPFGHNGERALDDCMASSGGFEGNAQTLRILAVTEKKAALAGGGQPFSVDGGDMRLGLDPTFRSLAAVLKYDQPIPKKRTKKAGESISKGYYESESLLVRQIRKNVAPSLKRLAKLKTLECQIMDLADDIAYSTYDLEDGLKGGFVNPQMLLETVRSNTDVLSAVTTKVAKECVGTRPEDVVSALAELFGLNESGYLAKGVSARAMTPLAMYRQSQNLSENGYVRLEFTSQLVHRFISNVTVSVNTKNPALSEVSLDKALKLQVETLKHLNYEITIMSPRLKLVEYRGYEIVTEIFKALAGNEGYLLLPNDLRACYMKLGSGNRAARMRLICDFVAGMTDRYAIEFFGRLKHGDQSIFKPF